MLAVAILRHAVAIDLISLLLQNGRRAFFLRGNRLKFHAANAPFLGGMAAKMFDDLVHGNGNIVLADFEIIGDQIIKLSPAFFVTAHGFLLLLFMERIKVVLLPWLLGLANRLSFLMPLINNGDSVVGNGNYCFGDSFGL